MLNILHIASFNGNIGDVYNHRGMSLLFDELFSNAKITRIEIRDFYFCSEKHRRFDAEYAEEVNRYDLCILGGGGFFDVRWEDSKTGTTLDISDDFINVVKIPVWINAMGYHEFASFTTQQCLAKFSSFIDVVSQKDNWLLTLRNDGSYKRIATRFGDNFAKKFIIVPDNAFSNNAIPYKLCKDKNCIGLCITNDLFSVEYNGNLDLDRFNSGIVNFITNIVRTGTRIVLFQHAPQDVELNGIIFSKLDNKIKRNMVVIAPYSPLDDASSVDEYLKWYIKCEVIIAMRFHSCIMGFVLGVPTIALAGHSQISDFFEELGMKDYCLKVDSDNVFDSLNKSIHKVKSNEYNSIVRRTKETLNASSRNYLYIVNEFLSSRGLL